MLNLLIIAGLIISSAIFIAIAVVCRFQRKRHERNIILAQELWEQLILRSPTEDELQDVIMAQGPLQEKAAQKLLEIGQKKTSFLLVSIFGRSLAERGWDRYLLYDKKNIISLIDLKWLVIEATNPKVKEQASIIILEHCKELLISAKYERLYVFRDTLEYIAKNMPLRKEAAELLMLENNKKNIINKIIRFAR